MEFIIVLLSLIFMACFLTIISLNKENEELKGTVRARTRALRNAETKIKQRTRFIKDVESKNEKQKEFIEDVIWIATSNKYKNEKVFMSKLKELVSDYQSKN